MKARELQNCGIPRGEPIKLALEAIGAAMKAGMTRDAVRTAIKALAQNPEDHVNDPAFGALASSLIKTVTARARFEFIPTRPQLLQAPIQNTREMGGNPI